MTEKKTLNLRKKPRSGRSNRLSGGVFKRWPFAAPFVGVALVWGMGSLAYLFRVLPPGQRGRSLIGFGLLWGACCLNLLMLSQTVSKTLSWVADTGQNRSPAKAVQIIFWGTMKLMSLGLLGSLIWRSESVPGMTLVLGLSTLVVVPLFGGYLWSKTTEP